MIAYLRRLLPMALWMMLVFAVGSIIVNDRVDLVLSGDVPPLRLAGAAVMIVVAGFISSAITDWGERRKRRKAHRH